MRKIFITFIKVQLAKTYSYIHFATISYSKSMRNITITLVRLKLKYLRWIMELQIKMIQSSKSIRISIIYLMDHPMVLLKLIWVY